MVASDQNFNKAEHLETKNFDLNGFKYVRKE